LRELTPSEILAIREMLQFESNALTKARVTKPMITDDDLRKQADSGIQATEARIKGLQQFVVENNVISIEEVH